MDWYPFYPNDFRRDTYHLTLEEDGAYRRLIDEYMITGETLPSDDASLARIVGLPTAEWERIAPRIRSFFRLKNDRLWHKRCASEINAQQMRHVRNSEKAKKAAFARYSKIKRLPATSMLEPATRHNKEITTAVYSAAAKGTAEEELAHNPAQPEKRSSATSASPELLKIMHAKGWGSG